MDENILIIHPPIFLIGKNITCWKCYRKMPVVTILAENIDDTYNEICILAEIVNLPEEVLGYIQKRVPSFRFKYSQTLGKKYFANTCPNCDVISGDFYLHSELGAPFFPTSEEEASFLYLTKIPIKDQILVQSSLSIGVGEIILNHAKRIV